MAAGFNPGSPEAGRWRAWLSAALARSGIPGDARLELRLLPAGEAPMARLCLDA